MAEILTSREVAEYLRTSPDTVKRLARAGRLPGIKLGRAWRFRKADLDDLFAEPMVDRALADEAEKRVTDTGDGDYADWDDVKKDAEGPA
ncbi:MAG TPA: helix-turn-helix domain-containing protein [Armatimonadota bacterium]|nr:helix-turn-helix domain-containing protein [Armatimonadota bacterium]